MFRLDLLDTAGDMHLRAYPYNTRSYKLKDKDKNQNPQRSPMSALRT